MEWKSFQGENPFSDIPNFNFRASGIISDLVICCFSEYCTWRNSVDS